VGCLIPEDGTDRFPETSVRNYDYSLRNNPEDRRSHPLRGVSLESFIIRISPIRNLLSLITGFGSIGFCRCGFIFSTFQFSDVADFSLFETEIKINF